MVGWQKQNRLSDRWLIPLGSNRAPQKPTFCVGFFYAGAAAASPFAGLFWAVSFLDLQSVVHQR
jgi:hypothetical protein